MLPQLILFKPSYNRVNFSKYFKGFLCFFEVFLKKRWYNKCYPNWFCLSLAIEELILVNILTLSRRPPHYSDTRVAVFAGPYF